VSVCLSVRSHTSKNTLKIHELYVYMLPVPVVPLCPQPNTLCTSDFVDDSMFTPNRATWRVAKSAYS